jgi:hypothetical protein
MDNFKSVREVHPFNCVMTPERRDSEVRMNADCWSTSSLSTASVQLENKITGRESQGACPPEELVGGKLPVVK